MKRLATAFVFLAPVLALAGEGPNWGEFTREELFATHFPEAPGAAAVVLWDSRVLKLTQKFELKTYRHCRTKIFDPARTERVHLEIPYWHEDDLSGFKAHTFVPPQDRVKVEKSHMRTEQVGDWKYLIVDFPSVAPGTILEYSYELRSEDLSRIPPWHFQGPDYTRASRTDLQLPEGVAFQAFFGWMPGDEPQAVRAEIRDPEMTSRLLVQNTWMMNDVRPLAAVPFESSAEEHRPTLFIELQALDSTRKNLKIAKTWEELAQSALPWWESVLAETKQLGAWSSAALAPASTPAEKAAAAFRLVRDGIAAKEAYREEAREDLLPAATVAAGTGTPRAKNALLLALLRMHGIEAHPVLVTTAERGVFQERYHCVDQFDHVVVQAGLDGGAVFLDASHPHLPFGVLSPRAGAHGLLVAAPGGRVIELPPPSEPSGRTSKTTAQLAEDGSLSASSVCRWTGYSAIEARAAIARKGPNDWAHAMLAKRFPEVSVANVEVTGEDADDQDLVLSVSYRIQAYAERKNFDLLCAAPLPFVQTENPVTGTSRTVPFDFGYASSTSDEVKLLLPEGFAVADPPATTTARTSAVLFRTNYVTHGSAVTVTREFEMKEARVPHREASALAACFDDVVTADHQTFLAKRRPIRAGSR